mgnify:FL=1
MLQSEFYSLGLNATQLQEVHRSLLARFIVEDGLRREQGLEPAEYPPLLEHIERLLRIDGETAHRAFHKEEDELWEYSWYSFTDEWAWFRAKQDLIKELGSKAERTPSKVLEARIEQIYEERFDSYTAELDMEDASDNGKRATRRSRLKKK